MLAGIEAGGTKIVCAIGPDPLTIIRQTVIPTGRPMDTLDAVLRFLRDGAANEAPVSAIGIGSFGPLDLDPASSHFGAITSTPKAGWSGVNLRTHFRETLGCPVSIDTDVNAAGIAEAVFGAGRGLHSIAYVTVGTGIGGGLIVNDKPLRGLSHPEMGHFLPRRHVDDTFPGICPFHGDCLEGLASGTAIRSRLGGDLDSAPPSHVIWPIVAHYLGQLCASLVLMCSPQRIVLGGGVLRSNPRLLPMIWPAALGFLGGYMNLADRKDDFITAPSLGDRSGIVGALLMADPIDTKLTKSRMGPASSRIRRHPRAANSSAQWSERSD